MAVKTGEFEYTLFTETDVNSTFSRHNQVNRFLILIFIILFSKWFYFQCSNIIANTCYHFKFVNLSKPNSQFNFGMQPVMYSSNLGTWTRAGENISYFKY